MSTARADHLHRATESGAPFDEVADLRSIAEAFRQAASSLGDSDDGWRVASLAAQLDWQADLAELERRR